MTSENHLKFMALSWMIKYHLAKLSVGAANDGVALLQFTVIVEREAAEAMGCNF